MKGNNIGKEKRERIFKGVGSKGNSWSRGEKEGLNKKKTESKSDKGNNIGEEEGKDI